MSEESFDLKQGYLTLTVQPSCGRVSLYWDGIEITKNSGFMSIVGTRYHGRYYSDKAVWEINRVSDREVQVRLNWPDIPLTQLWGISLVDERTVHWKVQVIPSGRIEFEGQEVELTLSPDYKKWMNSSERGVFPLISRKQNDWVDVGLKNYKSRSVGVKDSVRNGVYKPAVILDFRGTDKYTEPVIRNSGFSSNLRSIAVRIKDYEQFGDEHENKTREVFSGDIKLIDNKRELNEHLESCRREDRRVLLETFLRNQNEIRNERGLKVYLYLKFLHYREERGLVYAVYRGFAYIVYLLKTYSLNDLFFDFFNFKKKRKRERVPCVLEKGKLKLLVDEAGSSVRLIWEGRELTRYSGFITATGDRSLLRRYSPHASWDARQAGPDSATIYLRWRGFPVEQRWEVRLENETSVDWDIWMTTRRKISLAEKEAGLMLSADYTRWINSYEEGEFVKIEPDESQWKDMQFWNLSSRSIGVRGCRDTGGYSPAIILDFAETNGSTEPKIRNSDYRAYVRALLVQMKAGKPLQTCVPGTEYHVFSGKIKIAEDENIIDRHIIDCKRKLYRERLPFIEEKMPKKYLSKILGPVEVMLVNLPWKNNGRWGVRAGSRWPHIKDEIEDVYLPFPFFLAYAGALLLEQGVSVRVVDAIAENIDYDRFVELVNELEPYLLIAEVSTPSLKNDLEILKRIKRDKTKIAVCGVDFNIRQPRFLKENEFIDFVMVGEYEYTSLDLFKHLKDGRDLRDVNGLIYRDKGEMRTNPPRPLIDDLDKLPWPLREQLFMEKYMDAPGKIPIPSVQMWASRGCPFGCTFCAWPQLLYNSKSYRTRSPKAIVDEMEYLVKERMFKSIYFDDDTFNINKNNVLAICREIKERGLDIPWAIMARADTMDEEMLLKMKEAGLQSVKYGVESAEQRLIDSICKNMDLKKAERMIDFTRSQGLKMHLTFTFGLPGETQDTIKRTIDYAMKLDPDTVQFSILTPYPGTEYYRQMDAQGCIASKNWSDYDGASKAVVKTKDFSPADLERAKETALRMWKKHRRRKRTFITMPFDQELQEAFRNSLEKKGVVHTLAKTARYILDI